MSRTDWKTKSLENAREKKQLKKRIKEITKSRDDWKGKSLYHKSRADKLESDLKKLKNKLTEIIDSQ